MSGENQEKTPFIGRQSGKSSNKFFGHGLHPKGNGASTGNGRDSDHSILGKIVAVFKKPTDD